MAVMITGGSGFLGLALAEALARREEPVVLLALAPPPDWAMRMLASAGARPSCVAADVTEAGAVAQAIRRHGVTRIVHGAAVTADSARERREARRIVDVNVAGTVEVLEAALSERVAKVVQLGTGSVFGDAGLEAEHLGEDVPRPLPETLYGISKHAAERIGIRYRTHRELNLVLARVGTAFGRWEYRTDARDTPSLPFGIMERAGYGEVAVVPKGAGGDWIYSVDAAEGILRLLEDPGLSPEPVYHLSSGRWWDAMEWATALARHMPGLRMARERDGLPANVGVPAPAPRAPFDVGRIGRDYGFRARFDLETSVRDLIAWTEARARLA